MMSVWKCWEFRGIIIYNLGEFCFKPAKNAIIIFTKNDFNSLSRIFRNNTKNNSFTNFESNIKNSISRIILDVCSQSLLRSVLVQTIVLCKGICIIDDISQNNIKIIQ